MYSINVKIRRNKMKEFSVIIDKDEDVFFYCLCSGSPKSTSLFLCFQRLETGDHIEQFLVNTALTHTVVCPVKVFQ